MGDQRTFVGVRISPQGKAYVHYVAQRDGVTFSEALRRLLSDGARLDKERNDNPIGSIGRSSATRQGDATAQDRAGLGADPDHEREDERPDRDRDSDRSSQGIPELPDRGDGPTLGDALANLTRAGLNPTPLDQRSA